MAVAVKTTAIKASAMEDSEAPFRDGIEPTPMDVSNNTLPAGSVDVPRNEAKAHDLSARRNSALRSIAKHSTPWIVQTYMSDL